MIYCSSGAISFQQYVARTTNPNTTQYRKGKKSPALQIKACLMWDTHPTPTAQLVRLHSRTTSLRETRGNTTSAWVYRYDQALRRKSRTSPRLKHRHRAVRFSQGSQCKRYFASQRQCFGWLTNRESHQSVAISSSDKKASAGAVISASRLRAQGVPDSKMDVPVHDTHARLCPRST